MGDAAHDTTLKIGGSSTAFTGEATTDLGADVYQINATAKQVWDPAVTPTVTDFDGVVSASEYTVNYLEGKVTFSVAPVDPVTVAGSYIPLLTIATATSASVEVTNELVDDTAIKDSGADRTNLFTEQTISGQFTMLEDLLTDLVAGIFILGDITERSGTDPPLVTITGTPDNDYLFVIDLTLGGARGVAPFRWSINGGSTWEASGVVTAATNVLGTTGLTANFPVGTYTDDNAYYWATYPMTLDSVIRDQGLVFLESWPGQAGKKLRTWAHLSHGNVALPVEGAVGATVDWQGTDNNGVTYSRVTV